MARSTTKLVLMNKNTPVLECEYDLATEQFARITDVYNAKAAPLGMFIEHTDGERLDIVGVRRWWKDRPLPETRINIKNLTEGAQINLNALLRRGRGLSLIDQYWLKEPASGSEWSKINYFENGFDEEFGQMLFGKASAKPLEGHLSFRSPDIATPGNLMKKWVCDGGRRYLVKGGESFLNQEPYNEVIATRLYQRLLEPGEYVEYELYEEDGYVYSKCANMLTPSEELVPAYEVSWYFKKDNNASPYQRYLNNVCRLGIKDAQVLVDKMVICDYILANRDRHWANFGLIRNVETLAFERIAPIYDSGASLQSNINRVLGEDELFRFVGRPFSRDIEKQLGYVGGLEWYHPEKLEGFAKEAAGLLAQSGLGLLKEGEQRIQTVIGGLEKRIANMAAQASRRSIEKSAIERAGVATLGEKCAEAAKSSAIQQPPKGNGKGDIQR